MKAKPPIEEMKKHLRYDEETGHVWWTKSGHGRDLSLPVGSRHAVPFVEFNGSRTRCSHIAWAFHYGEWPGCHVVNMNGDKKDNRICNLRLYDKYRNPSSVKKPDRVSDAEIRESFEYDPSSGMIFMLVCGERVNIEKTMVVKTRTNTKYRVVNFKSNKFLSHRLAWFLHYGKWPDGDVDHENQNGLDNRINNLRDVSHGENLRNARRSKSNKSGVTGVYWHKVAKKWHATIGVNGVQVHLGLFDNLEEAKLVRKEAELKHGFHPNHGTLR